MIARKDQKRKGLGVRHCAWTNRAAGCLEPKGEQTAVFSGGCFWGVDAIFNHVKGVSKVGSGYAGEDSKVAA